MEALQMYGRSIALKSGENLEQMLTRYMTL